MLLVVLVTLLVGCSAAPSRPIVVPDLPLAGPVPHHAPVVAAPVAVVTSQSHAQDELGQYSYSYSNPLSAKVETKTVDGITRGGYSYLDSHGLVQNVKYVSDDVHGFRVAGSNLPLGPVTPQQDEPLVAHEKAKAVAALHEAAVKEAAEAAIAHENEVAGAPVYVEAHALPAAPSTPAPPVYVSTAAPEVHVTPSPVSFISPPAPVVHVTPSAYHPPSPSPTPVHAYPVVEEHPHTYAIVELDSSDIPAPVPTPGAYFHPSPSAVAYSPLPSTPAPTSHVYEEHVEVSPPAPSPTPVVFSPSVAHAAPTPVVHVTPAPLVVHPSPTPAPVVPSAPEVAHAPVVHAAPAPAPVVHSVPVHAAPAVVAAPVAVVTSQSHAQDELGQYSYSYSNPLSAKVETKTVDGITRGGYSYLDSHGLVQNVNYVSDDHNGFRVAASNLPTAAVPVDIPDSHDVAAAKAVFFAEIAKAKAEVAHANAAAHH